MSVLNSEYVLIAGVLLLIVLDIFRNRLNSERKDIIQYATLAILVLAFAVEIMFGDFDIPFFSTMQYSQFVNGFILFLAIAIYSFLLADSRKHSTFIEFLFILAVLGAMLVVISSNFISLLIAIEMISLASYGLVFFQKSNANLEGAMKYVSISFLSMVILIFGISLVYGGTGTLSFGATYTVNYLPFIAGLSLVMVGLAFKSTIVPFHMWAPDVYEASNGAVTAFLSSISKAAGLIAMVRVFFFAFPASSAFVSDMFIILAIATIFFATFLATVQERIKRLLAYSSIAQAGFAFIGIALLNYSGVSAAIFYIFSFAVADALVFLAYKVFEDAKIVYKKDASKMWAVSKVGVVCLFIGVLSLTGFPPTIGFFGKLLIFSALLSNGYVYLVVSLFVILLFSTFFYFALLRDMNPMENYKSNAKRTTSIRIKEAILIALTLALFFGVVFVTF